jgi:K+-transporting ATPase c subunit
VATVRDLVQRSVQRRQFGFLGEERVNVLLLNTELDRLGH